MDDDIFFFSCYPLVDSYNIVNLEEVVNQKNQVKNLQYISRHSGDSYQLRLETLALLENPVGLREQFFRNTE